MVVLARAFAARPAFLLIDEMSLGLAPVVFTRLLPVVSRFAAEGAAILLVEQFTHLALGVAQEALVVSSGRVTYSGDAQTLLDSAGTLHAAYLGA
jgi:branched-chain amino acid transport system ATP-binding protein